MEYNIKEFDCQRGCEKLSKCTNGNCTPDGEKCFKYNRSCCKLSVFDWLENASIEDLKDFYEVRFKNTRKNNF
jgi:hypothetical protein